jgi:BirA family transcriptional regulator, biotin operon repressor / biotin---[acetyl-CoA-carboxylase] ligase
MTVRPIEHIDTEPWPFVKSMVTLEEVDSTSDRAARLVRDPSIALPCCVWAERQTRGRGRGSHAWWSDSGSLTFSLAIDPAAHRLNLESEPKLALATAVAVIDALSESGLATASLGIRWPNDIEVQGHKLGGILPERIELEEGHRLLIGVGLNVLSNLAAAPADVRRLASSLRAMQADPLDEQIRPRLLAGFLQQFERVLVRLAEGDPELAVEWNRLDLLRGAWVSVDLGARVVAGRGCGIGPDGALLLDDGRTVLHILGGQVLR